MSNPMAVATMRTSAGERPFPSARWVPLLGRLMLGGVYVINGVGLIGAFGAVAGMMASKGVPVPAVLLVLTIVAWLLGGACLLSGWRSRQAAFALAIITVPVTLCIHAPWTADAAAFQNELNHFLKNLAIIGGLLLVAGAAPACAPAHRDPR